jgi:D-beta-D-heptose 7-phosphate kinase/D-beta-D-heptose 1-phosphate adenosyltransferase
VKVFTNGCFDILHRGHIELLKYCASLGDVIVGLNSDESVARLKGPSRPLVRAEDRKIVLESIKYVESVYVFQEDTPYELIKILKPDLIVKGGDYQPHQVAGFDLCEVRIFNFLEGYSSSGLIRNLSGTQTN